MFEDKKVQFEDWKRPNNSYSSSSGSKFSQLVIKYSGGLVQNEKQANVILFGVIVVAVIVSLVLINKNNTSSPPSKNEIINIAGPEI